MELHLEISTKCMLRCHACPRTKFKGKYSVRDLPLDVIRRIGASTESIETVVLCGNHGDPIYHSDFHQVVRILQGMNSHPNLHIATNGSHRSSEWWRETAEILRPEDVVVFGVDGLEHTSHIYRENQDWHSVVDAMRILKDKGCCQVRWQWILFRYNQHQLTEAKKISLEIGIDAFLLISSGREHQDDRFLPTVSLEEAKRTFGTS